eukprot:3246858-Amphidinium_carterae.1
MMCAMAVHPNKSAVFMHRLDVRQNSWFFQTSTGPQFIFGVDYFCDHVSGQISPVTGQSQADSDYWSSLD